MQIWLKYLFSKTSKKQILTVALENNTKISVKRLYKSLSCDFLHDFFSQHFSNRPYPNNKIILVYFFIIKTI